MTSEAAFLAAKKEYVRLREEERRLLVAEMQKWGLFDKVVTGSRAGHGVSNYGKGRKSGVLARYPYDLSNWKWVEARQGELTILVSFQACDLDPSTGNRHVLFDRIGLYVCSREDECRMAYEVWDRMLTTDVELPLNDEKLARLKKLVEKLIRLGEVEREVKDFMSEANPA